VEGRDSRSIGDAERDDLGLPPISPAFGRIHPGGRGNRGRHGRDVASRRRTFASQQRGQQCAILRDARDSERVSGYFSSDWCVQRRKASSEPSSRLRKQSSLRHVFDGESLSIFRFPPSKFESAFAGPPVPFGSGCTGSSVPETFPRSAGGVITPDWRPVPVRARS
jgi:hypothetical protein